MAEAGHGAGAAPVAESAAVVATASGAVEAAVASGTRALSLVAETQLFLEITVGLFNTISRISKHCFFFWILAD